MENKLNLSSKLNFEDIDMTAPEIVIKEIINQLPEETGGLILGSIDNYNGHVKSYMKRGLSSLSLSLGTRDTEVNIQDDLGKRGSESHKFECYLYTSNYSNYKYRMFFIEYGVANYPVDIVLESSLAKSALGNSSYIVTCNTKEELEDLVFNVLTSKRAVAVMQELIRINQSKKNKESDEQSIEATEE